VNYMRKTFLAGSALALLMGVTAAEAADLTAPVYKAAAVAPAWNWSGFYFGVNAGALTDHGDVRQRSVITQPPGTPFERLFSDTFAKTGVIAGGQVGYNWQSGITVLGLEADADWSNLKNTTGVINDPFFFGKSSTGTITSRIDWLATFRGRAGIAATPNLLLYVTGGAAAAGLKVSYSSISADIPPFNVPPFTLPPQNLSSSKTLFGWTAGFGAEFALGSNWSVKGEYLHAAFDSATPINADFSPILPSIFTAGTTGSGTIKVNNSLDLIRFGVNYKL
jgi:outer membrane immunogenic protein